MRNLGPLEAANEIRNDVTNLPGIDPAEQHHVRFIQSVCGQLGLDPSPENMHKVAVVLHKHDIGMHHGHEFPKYAVRDWDKTSKIVHNEQEEKEWVEEARPEIAAPVAVREQTDPVQGLGVDLRDKVPHMVPTSHPAGRAPDAQTNRAASQQPEPETVDHQHVDTGDVTDDEVHVEDAVDEPELVEPVKPAPRKRPQ